MTPRNGGREGHDYRLQRQQGVAAAGQPGHTCRTDSTRLEHRWLGVRTPAFPQLGVSHAQRVEEQQDSVGNKEVWPSFFFSHIALDQTRTPTPEAHLRQPGGLADGEWDPAIRGDRCDVRHRGPACDGQEVVQENDNTTFLSTKGRARRRGSPAG